MWRRAHFVLLLLAWSGVARAQSPILDASMELDASAAELAAELADAFPRGEERGADEPPSVMAVAAPEDAGASAEVDAAPESIAPAESPETLPDAGVPAVPAQVIVRAHVAFDVRRAFGGRKPAERARVAAEAIEAAIESDVPPPPAVLVSSLAEPGARQLRLAEHEVLTFDEEDAAAADLALDAYAEDLRARVDAFVAREREKAELQSRFSSVALIVLFGVCLLAAVRLVRSLGRRADEWVQSKTSALPGVSFGQFEVLSAQTVQSATYVLVGATRLLTLLGLLYAYAAYSFNQFESTRAWIPHLTHALLGPFFVLGERIGGAVPALLLFVVAVYVVRACFRFLGFFFEHLGQGEVGATWLPPDLAPAARPIARAALVIVAFLALGPLVSGNSDGLLSRVGFLAVAGLALAGIPVTASALVGAVSIFTRRYRIGEWITVGKHTGELVEQTFLDLTLVGESAGRVRIPQLVTLWSPAHHLPEPPPVAIEVPMPKSASPDDVLAALTEAASQVGGRVEVTVVRVDTRAITYGVRVSGAKPGARSELLLAVARVARNARKESSAWKP